MRQGDRPLEAVLAERLVKAASQLEGDSVGDRLVGAAMQDRLGQSLLSLGFAEEAISVFKNARAARTALLGREHVDTLTSTCNLAAAYHLAGENHLARPRASGEPCLLTLDLKSACSSSTSRSSRS